MREYGGTNISVHDAKKIRISARYGAVKKILECPNPRSSLWVQMERCTDIGDALSCFCQHQLLNGTAPMYIIKTFRLRGCRNMSMYLKDFFWQHPFMNRNTSCSCNSYERKVDHYGR
jgi:hypothetical protein